LYTLFKFSNFLETVADLDLGILKSNTSSFQVSYLFFGNGKLPQAKIALRAESATAL